MVVSALGHPAERLAHDGSELAVHLTLVPAEVLKVLDPLEVGDDDPAGVRHHVGNHVDALVTEDLVGDRGGWARFGD